MADKTLESIDPIPLGFSTYKTTRNERTILLDSATYTLGQIWPRGAGKQ